LFISPEHGIGTEFSHTGVTGPSIFPVTGLGLRYRQEWTDWYAQAVVLDAIPGDPDDLRRTYVKLGDGSLLVGELGHTHGDLKMLLGAWRYSLELPDLVATDAQGDPLMRSGSSGAYALASYSFWTESDSGRDLSGFLRFGVADHRVYQVGNYLGVGVVAKGPWSARPKDRLGLALGVSGNGRSFRDAGDMAGTPVDTSELHAELSYRVLLGEHAFIQPTVHYVKNPGTDPALDDAWVAGLRCQAAAWYAQ
jgi:porin